MVKGKNGLRDFSVLFPSEEQWGTAGMWLCQVTQYCVKCKKLVVLWLYWEAEVSPFGIQSASNLHCRKSRPIFRDICGSVDDL